MATPDTSLRRKSPSRIVPWAVSMVGLLDLVCSGPVPLAWGQAPEGGFELPEEKLPGDTVPDMADPDEAAFYRDLAPSPAVEVTPGIDARLQSDDGFYIEATPPRVDNSAVLRGLQGSSDRFFDGVGGVPRPTLIDLRPSTSFSTFAFKAGPVRIRPRIGAEVVYNKISGRDSRKELVENLRLAVTALVGEYDEGRFLYLDYDGALRHGQKDQKGLQYDQSFALRGQYTFTKLVLDMGITYASLSGSDREFSGNTNRQKIDILGAAHYRATEKTSFDFDLAVPIEDYADGLSSIGATSTNFMNYAPTPKTSIGAGVAFGFITVESGRTQVFEQALVRFVSAPRQTLSYSATAGVDFRQAEGEMRISPIFALAASWTPREGTSLSLVGERRVRNSAAIQNADFTTTNFTLALSQRVSSRIELRPSVGYEYLEYRGFDQDEENANREDQTLFAQFAVNASLFQHCTLSTVVTYRHTDSINSQQQFQAGVQVSYQY